MYTNWIRICIQIKNLYKDLYTNYIQICIQSPLLHSSTSGCSCYWFKHDLHQYVNNSYIIWKPFVTKSRQAVNKLNRENAKQQPKTISGPLNIILTEHDERSSYYFWKFYINKNQTWAYLLFDKFGQKLSWKKCVVSFASNSIFWFRHAKTVLPKIGFF